MWRRMAAVKTRCRVVVGLVRLRSEVRDMSHCRRKLSHSAIPMPNFQPGRASYTLLPCLDNVSREPGADTSMPQPREYPEKESSSHNWTLAYSNVLVLLRRSAFRLTAAAGEEAFDDRV